MCGKFRTITPLIVLGIALCGPAFARVAHSGAVEARQTASYRFLAAEEGEVAFTGIGVRLGTEPTQEGYAEILSILPQAGEDVQKNIKKHDLITHVDGKSIKGLKI
jgi:C-terminal processing protease CtpA/Prc